MNLTDMLALVRRDLHDEDSANYRWTDLTLTRHISRALKEFSEAWPLQSTALLATTGGSREVSLASLSVRVRVEAVEYPVDRFPAVYSRFSLWGDILTLLVETLPDGSNCRVYYGQLHTLGLTSTIPAVGEDLIACGAAGYAAVGWSLHTINRVNPGGADTPALSAAWGREQLHRFRAGLKRLGCKNKVRVNQLYISAHPLPSLTDPGP